MTGLPPIYRRHLAAATGDVDELADVWEPDGTLDFPYAGSLGTPTRLVGIASITDYFRGLTGWSDWMFTDEVVRRVVGAAADDAEEFVVEMHGSADTGDGGRYEQDYVVRFATGPSGRIRWMREFWDPTRLG
jgi:ketosteroid isomerase-like protein